MPSVNPSVKMTGLVSFRKFLEGLEKGDQWVVDYLNAHCLMNVRSPWKIYKVTSGWLEETFGRRDIRSVRRALSKGPWRVICWGSNGERDSWAYFMHENEAREYLLYACAEREWFIANLPRIVMDVDNAIRHSIINSLGEFLDLVIASLPTGVLLLKMRVDELPQTIREAYPEFIDYLKALERESKLRCVDPCKALGEVGNQ